MTTNVNASQNASAKLFMMGVYPALTTFFTPWDKPAAWKAELLRSKQAVWTSVHLRDIESGGSVSVDTDPEARDPVIQYTFADADKKRRTEATITACKLFLEAGADEVHPILFGGDKPSQKYKAPKDRNYSSDPKWEEFVKYLEETLCGDSFTSAHPQGTCRMGSDSSTSVVDLDGKVWDHQGLYVADASLFPSASGVNPWLTVMALADHVGDSIIRAVG